MSNPFALRKAMSGRPVTGPGVRMDTTGFPARGCQPPSPNCFGRLVTGPLTTDCTTGIPATGLLSSVTTVGSPTATDIPVPATTAVIGEEGSSITTRPSTM